MMSKSRTLLLLAACLWAGCSESAPSGDSALGSHSEQAGLPGRWEVLSTVGAQSELQLGVLYTFTEDGRMTVGEGPLAAEGSWERVGDRLHITLAGVAMEVDIQLDADAMSYSIVNTDQVFRLGRLPE